MHLDTTERHKTRLLYEYPDRPTDSAVALDQQIIENCVLHSA